MTVNKNEETVKMRAFKTEIDSNDWDVGQCDRGKLYNSLSNVLF